MAEVKEYEKSTPGPWKFQYTDDSGECFIIAKNFGGLVGAALPWPTEIDARDFRRVIANARLIAAAPELLEALREATLALDGLAKGEGVFKPIEQTIVSARAAIAKASPPTREEGGREDV